MPPGTVIGVVVGASTGTLVRDSPSARFANRLDGFARGVEVLAALRNPNGLTGWVADASGRNRYHDKVSNEMELPAFSSPLPAVF